MNNRFCCTLFSCLIMADVKDMQGHLCHCFSSCPCRIKSWSLSDTWTLSPVHHSAQKSSGRNRRRLKESRHWLPNQSMMHIMLSSTAHFIVFFVLSVQNLCCYAINRTILAEQLRDCQTSKMRSSCQNTSIRKHHKNPKVHFCVLWKTGYRFGLEQHWVDFGRISS